MQTKYKIQQAQENAIVKMYYRKWRPCVIIFLAIIYIIILIIIKIHYPESLTYVLVLSLIVSFIIFVFTDKSIDNYLSDETDDIRKTLPDYDDEFHYH